MFKTGLSGDFTEDADCDPGTCPALNCRTNIRGVKGRYATHALMAASAASDIVGVGKVIRWTRIELRAQPIRPRVP